MTTTLTNDQFVDGLVDAIVAAGITVTDQAGLRTALKAVVPQWNDGSVTDAVLANTISKFVANQFQQQNQLYDWSNGDLTGGYTDDTCSTPGGPFYPFTDKTGTTRGIMSPLGFMNNISDGAVATATGAASDAAAAKAAAESARDLAQGYRNTAGDHATDAAASAEAASTSEGNASSSADAASTSEGNASASASAAAQSETLAQDWATKTSGEVVTGQGYGAKKYANDSATAQAQAAISAAAAAVSQAAAAAAAGLAVGASVIIGTHAAVSGLSVPGGLKSMTLIGRNLFNDGAGLIPVYRVDAQPSHKGYVRTTDHLLSDGVTVDATNGGYWVFNVEVPNIKQFNATCNGTADDSQAVADAVAYLPTNGGVVHIVGDKPTFNITITRNGIELRGQGIAQNQSSPSAKYWQPYDTTKAVVQIGNDTGYVSGCMISDACIRGNSTGQYGVVFGPGAYRNHWRNVQVQNFTNYCVGYLAGTNYPCVYNKGVGIQLTTPVAGARTVYFGGQDNANGYVTANEIVAYDITGPTGGFAVHVHGQAAGNAMGSGWIECASNGGFLFEKTAYIPDLEFSGTAVDSNASTDYLLLYLGEDLQGNGALGYRAIGGGVGGLTIDGKSLHSNTTTTGAISASSASLTVASATNIWAGRVAWVVGAGPGGAPLASVVKSVSGTAVTLTDTATLAVSGATVYIGDAPGQNLRTNQEMVSTSAIKFESSGHTRPRRPAEGKQVYGGGGLGTVAPWNSFGVIWDMGSAPVDMLFDSGLARTVTSMVRVGTTITVVFSSSHSCGVGALVDLRGGNEDGFNGVFAVASVVDANTITVTSPVSGNATATGTFINQIVRRVTYQYGALTLDNGYAIRMKDRAGNATSVLSASTVNDNFFFSTPSATDGGFVLTAGSNASTGSALSIDGGGVRCFQVNRYGAAAIGGNTASTYRGSLFMYDSTTTPGQTPSGGVFLYDNLDRLYVKTSAGTTRLLQTNESGATASRPTTNVATGWSFYDTSIDLPVFRNAANGAWVDALGGDGTALKLRSYLVSTLPTASSHSGCMAWVTDANAPAYNTAVSGGGSTGRAVQSDGSTWKT